MSWKFWRRKQKIEIEPSEMQILQEEISNLNKQMEQQDGQLKKMMRMQFTSSKNLEEKVESFDSSLSILEQENELLQQYKGREGNTVSSLIRLLDELDHVLAGLNDNEQQWKTVFDGWSKTLLESLKEMGVYELDVIGKTFDPEITESLQTVEKSELTVYPIVPYQIIEVLNRGYIYTSGKLIRKAKVVTVKENAE